MSNFYEVLAKCSSIFDIAALSYVTIIDSDEVSCCLEYNRNSSKLCLEYSKLIQTFIVTKDISILINSMEDIMKLSSFSEIIHCVAFIHHLDLAYKQKPFSTSTETIKRIKTLNELFSDRVKIYPNCNSTLFSEFKKNASSRKNMNAENNSINRLLNLNNYIFLRNSACSDYDISLINYNDHDFFENKIKSGNLKIAIIPLSSVNLKKIMNVDLAEDHYFSIHGFKRGQEEIMKQKILQALIIMEDSKVNIAVFPEMYLSIDILNAIKNYLKTCMNINLKLIIAGTIWENNTNQIYVLSGCGETILINKKYSPFEYKEDSESYFEKLQNGAARFINFLDIKSLGRLTITICLDFLNAANIFPNLLNCSVVIASSYTNSLDQFEIRSRNFIDTNKGLIVVSNTCAARNISKFKDLINIGYVAIPSINSNQTSSLFQYYKSNSKCARDCCDNFCFKSYDLILNKVAINETCKSIIINTEEMKLKLKS